MKEIIPIKMTIECCQKSAQREIVIARGLYNSTSEKKKLKANLHFYNALIEAQEALKRIQLKEVIDNTVMSNMKAIIEESRNHLPHDIEGAVEEAWRKYLSTKNRIYRELFGVFFTKKDEKCEERERRYLECRKMVFEGYSYEYAFLTQDKFVHFFNDSLSIYDNGSLYDGFYTGCACYTNTVLEFVILFEEFLEYRYLMEILESKVAIRYQEIWTLMRQKYMKGKLYVQIDEMIEDGRLEKFSADEVIAAIYFCLMYKERFCEGYFLDCCEAGIIGKLLLRLKNIYIT